MPQRARPAGIRAITAANLLAAFAAAGAAWLTLLPQPRVLVTRIFPMEWWGLTTLPLIVGGPITVAVFAALALALLGAGIGIWRYERVTRWLELGLLTLGGTVAGICGLVLGFFRSPVGLLLQGLAAAMNFALFYLMRPEVKELFGESPEPASTVNRVVGLGAILVVTLAGAFLLFLVAAKGLQGLR
jgi:hypothetical protein